MKNICQIFITDFKRIKTNVVAVVIMLGLIILPSLYAWFNILGPIWRGVHIQDQGCCGIR